MYLEDDKRNVGASAEFVAYLDDGENEVVIELKVPGYKKEDIEVKANKESIKVYGKGNEKVGRGRWANTFYNKFPIGEEGTIEVDASSMKAAMADGILTIRVPVAEKFQSTTVTIE